MMLGKLACFPTKTNALLIYFLGHLRILYLCRRILYHELAKEKTQEMLDFCAENGVLYDVEVIALQKVNEAYDRVMKSDVRCRFVIAMNSQKETL